MIGLWDMGRRKGIKEFKAHEIQIAHLAFSPDGTRLASASIDGTAKVWNLADLQEPLATPKRPLQAMGTISFSPDGTRLATGGDHGLVQLWDMETFQEVAVLKRREHIGRTFFPNNDSVVTAGQEEPKSSPLTVVLLRAASLEEIRSEEQIRARRQ